MARKKRDIKPRDPKTERTKPGKPTVSADVRAALEQIDRVLDSIENDLPDNAWDKGGDFIEDVDTRLKAMKETISLSNDVTPRQLSALNSWETAIGKWIDPRGD